MNENLLKISYDMELSEIEEGFKLFQKKYQFKRTVIFTIVYAIAAVLGIDMIARNYQNFYGYLLTGIGIGLVFMQWYRPVMIRKKLINTLSSMTQETYETEIFSDKIQITTTVLAEETEDNEQTDMQSAEEKAEQTKEERVTSTFFFGADYMDAMENEQMFLLFVNKSLIYIYPKRCLSEDQQDTLRRILTEKAILL
ncbi:MAG: YcxB family protein [Ruminiclostridium sp.]|nr:YcxB family protein [Ruminiclostridium sp.]